jgi:hypothetical protein
VLPLRTAKHGVKSERRRMCDKLRSPKIIGVRCVNLNNNNNNHHHPQSESPKNAFHLGIVEHGSGNAGEFKEVGARARF